MKACANHRILRTRQAEIRAILAGWPENLVEMFLTKQPPIITMTTYKARTTVREITASEFE